jgi:hypothetical protein
MVEFAPKSDSDIWGFHVGEDASHGILDYYTIYR